MGDIASYLRVNPNSHLEGYLLEGPLDFLQSGQIFFRVYALAFLLSSFFFQVLFVSLRIDDSILSIDTFHELRLPYIFGNSTKLHLQKLWFTRGIKSI